MVALVINDQAIHYSVLQRTSGTIKLIQYRNIMFNAQEIVDGRLFNVSFIQHQLKKMSKQDRLSKPFAAFALSGITQDLVEYVVACSEVPSSWEQLKDNRLLHDKVWIAHALGYNHHTHKYYYYIFGLTRELLFQYQLLSYQSNLNCILITTASLSLLHTIFAQTSVANLVLAEHDYATVDDFIFDCMNQSSIAMITGNVIERKHYLEALGLFRLGMYEYV